MTHSYFFVSAIQPNLTLTPPHTFLKHSFSYIIDRNYRTASRTPH